MWTSEMQNTYLIDPTNHIMLGKDDKRRIINIPSLSKDEKVKLVNKFRNYIRYKVIKTSYIGELQRESSLKILTPEEKFLLEQYNIHHQAFHNYRQHFLEVFYQKGAEVGSTLKPVQTKNINLNDFI